MSTPAFADLAQITVEELEHDPYPIYARMRHEAPVCFVPAVGLWFVTRWADVEHAASHVGPVRRPEVQPSPLDSVRWAATSILLLDGEPQKRLRAMLDPSLRPRVVEATAPELVAPLVERAARRHRRAWRGRADEPSYFEPVSVLSLGRVLGLGHLDGDMLRRWFHGLAQGAINFEDDSRDGPSPTRPEAESTASLRRSRAPVGRAGRRARSRSCSSTPAAPSTSGWHGSCRRLKVILLGGMQEPGHAAGSTVAGLLESGQAVALAADPAGIVSDAVEEGLRWVSPIGTQTRRAVAETELGGVTLPAGANLGVLVSSANRDATVWGDTADAFDLFRPRRNHAAFGFGPLSARATTSRACRCGSRSGFSSSGSRAAGGPGPAAGVQRREFRAPRHLRVRLARRDRRRPRAGRPRRRRLASVVGRRGSHSWLRASASRGSRSRPGARARSARSGTVGSRVRRCAAPAMARSSPWPRSSRSRVLRPSRFSSFPVVLRDGRVVADICDGDAA